MQTDVSQPRSIAPFAAAAALVWLVGGGLCAILAPVDVRSAVVAGAIAAGIGAAAALTGLAYGIRHGTSGLLAGFAAGFFARMITVAVGLVASGAQGRSALAYAASFFAFYAATQAIEIAYVWASSQAGARRTAAKA